jgi:hypothetical protein
MIAATALVLKMLLVHHNAGDFERMRTVIESSPGRSPGLGPLSLVSCESLV